MDRCNKICGHVAPLSLFILIYMWVYCIVFVAAINLTHSAFTYKYTFVCCVFHVHNYSLVRRRPSRHHCWGFVESKEKLSWLDVNMRGNGDYCFLIFVCNALVKWILWIFIALIVAEVEEEGVDEDNSWGCRTNYSSLYYDYYQLWYCCSYHQHK